MWLSKGGRIENTAFSTFVWLIFRKDTSGDNAIEYVLAKADTKGVWVSVYTFKDIVVEYIKSVNFLLGYEKNMLS